jgi:phospholipase A1
VIKKSLILCGLLGILIADDGSYAQAVHSFNAKEYTKAFPGILEAAKKGNKEAQGQMAYMYENGLGTSVDYKQALYWYKQAAPVPVQTAMDTKAGKNIAFDEQVVADAGQNNPQEIEKLHMSYLAPTKEIGEVLKGRSNFFGLQPYHENYLLPVSYLKDKPRRVSAAVSPNSPEGKALPGYDNNTEVEFQISLKKEIFHDWFGFGESLTAAYSQHVWWQLYSPSGPFRETNYMPELFLTVPTSQNIAEEYGLKAVKTGFIHQSNGQDGYRSRSWNRIYAEGIWQWDNLLLSTRAWYRLPEDRKSDAYYAGELGIAQADEKGDDNPDIYKYMGYGDIQAKYLYGQSEFGLLFRNNLQSDGNKGAIELNYSYPAFGSKDMFWYAKVFNGYGYSMIDYDHSVTNAAFGFSFSR